MIVFFLLLLSPTGNHIHREVQRPGRKMFFPKSSTHVGISSVNSRVARTVKVFRSSLNLSLKQSGLLLPNAQHSQLSTISETKWTTPILPKAQPSQLSTDAPNLPGSDISNAHNSQFYRKESFAVHFSSTFNSIFQPFFFN